MAFNPNWGNHCMKRPFLTLLVALLMTGTACADSATSETPSKHPVGPSIEKVCAGTTRPGWVMVDDLHDANLGCPDNGPHNVWVIEKLDDLPVGSTLEICHVPVVPLRWYLAGNKWDSERCGHPVNKGADNIMIIRRAH